MASNPFFTPYLAAPDRAPAATAFPPAINAGMRAASGSIPTLSFSMSHSL